MTKFLNTVSGPKVDVSDIIVTPVIKNADVAPQPEATPSSIEMGDLNNGSAVVISSPTSITLDAFHVSASSEYTPTNEKDLVTKDYVASALAELDNEKQAALVSGTNIKTINSVSLLGSGNFDLVPTLRTVNDKALSSNITLTTADITDSTDKRYTTDAEKTKLSNLSGTNTGDQDLTGKADKVVPSASGNIATLSTSGNLVDSGSKILEKATGAEINTGTDNDKFLTPKSIVDSNVAFTGDIPTKVSDLSNDSGFITTADIPTIPTDISDLTDSTHIIPAPYTLPAASTTVLGGVKVDGTTISITNGVISGANTLAKASGSDINTGTDDTKYITSKAVTDSKISITDHTETLTNKAIVKRVVTTTDDATAVIDVGVTDIYELSAVTNATTFSTTGSPTDGQKLMIRFKDAGTAKALTWDTVFVAIGVTAPTTTVAGKWHYVGCEYNAAATKWHILAVAVQA
jgi:hypothetical protein